MNLSPKAQQTLLLILAVLAVLWYLKTQAGKAADAAVEAVNPTDPDNLANRSFNWLYQTVTGSEGTAGTDLAAWMQGDE